MSDDEVDDVAPEDEENADHLDLVAPFEYEDDEPAEQAFVPEHLRGEKFDEEDNDDHIKQLELALAKAKPKYEDMVLDEDAFENALFGMEYMEENLGENFEDTPWLPPTVGKMLLSSGVVASLCSSLMCPCVVQREPLSSAVPRCT